MRLGKRASEHCKILRKHIDQPAVDRAIARNDTVAQVPFLIYAKIGAAVAHKLAYFLKRTLVEQ